MAKPRRFIEQMSSYRKTNKLSKVHQLFFIFLVFAFLPGCNHNNGIMLPIENVIYNKYDTADLTHGDKVFLTKFDGSISDSILIGKSTPSDIIKLFGYAKIDTVLLESPTTTENHYYYGKTETINYKNKDLTFTFYRNMRVGETPEDLYYRKDTCFLSEITVKSPANYYLDNVFIGMDYNSIIKKFGKPSYQIHNGIVYDSYGLHLTFDKEVYKRGETGRLKEIVRTDRIYFIKYCSHAEQMSYYANGQVKFKNYWKNGKLSESTFYNSNGIDSSKTVYRNDPIISNVRTKGAK